MESVNLDESKSNIVKVFLPEMAGNGLCDCGGLKCRGCFFPCHTCDSNKCGHVCRAGRFWTYFDWTPEQLRRTQKMEAEFMGERFEEKPSIPVVRKRRKYGTTMKTVDTKIKNKPTVKYEHLHKHHKRENVKNRDKDAIPPKKIKIDGSLNKINDEPIVISDDDDVICIDVEDVPKENMLPKAKNVPVSKKNIGVKKKVKVTSEKSKTIPIIEISDDECIEIKTETVLNKNKGIKKKNDCKLAKKVILTPSDFMAPVTLLPKMPKVDLTSREMRFKVNKIDHSINSTVNNNVKKRVSKLIPLIMPLSNDIIVIRDDEDVVPKEIKKKQRRNVSIRSIKIVDNRNVQSNTIKAAPKGKVQFQVKNDLPKVYLVKQNVLQKNMKINTRAVPALIPIGQPRNEIIVIKDDDDVFEKRKEIKDKKSIDESIECIEILDDLDIPTNNVEAASKERVLFEANNDLSHVSKARKNALGRNVRIEKDNFVPIKIPKAVPNKIIKLKEEGNVLSKNVKTKQRKTESSDSMQTKTGAVLKRNTETEENNAVSEKRVKITPTNKLRNECITIHKNDLVPNKKIKLEPIVAVKDKNIINKVKDVSTSNIELEDKDAVSRKRINIKPTKTSEAKINVFVSKNIIKLEPRDAVNDKNNLNEVPVASTSNIQIEEKATVSRKSVNIKPRKSLEAKNNVFVSKNIIKLEPRDAVNDKNNLNKVTHASTSNIQIEEKATASGKRVTIKPISTLKTKQDVLVPIINIKLEPKDKDTVKNANNLNKVTDVSTSSIQIEEKTAVSGKSVNIKPTNTLRAKKNVFVPVKNIKLEPLDDDKVKDKNNLNKVTDLSTTNTQIEENAAVPENSVNIESRNTLKVVKNDFIPIKTIKLEPVDKDTVNNKNYVSTSNIQIKENTAVPGNSVNIKATNTLNVKKNVFVPIKNIKLEPVEKDTVKDKNNLNKVTDVLPSDIKTFGKGAVPENSVNIEPRNSLDVVKNNLIPIKNIKLEPVEKDTVKDKNNLSKDTGVSTTNTQIEENAAVPENSVNIESRNTREVVKNDFVPIKNIKLEPVDKDTIKDKNYVNKVTDVSTSNIQTKENAAVPKDSVNIESRKTLEVVKNNFIPIKNIKLEPVDKDTVKDKNCVNKVTDLSTTNTQIVENAAVPNNSVNIEPTNTFNATNAFVPIENIKLEPVEKDTVKDKNNQNKVTDVSPSSIQIEENAAVPKNIVNIEPTNTLNAKKNVFVPITNIKLEPVEKDTVKDKNNQNKVSDVSTSSIQIEENAAVPKNSVNIEPINTLHAKKNVFVPITNIKLEPVDKNPGKDKNNLNKVTDVSPSNIKIEKNAAVPKNSINIEPTNTLHAKNNVFVPIENIKLEPLDKDTVKDKKNLNKVTDELPSNMQIEENAAVPENSVNIKATNTLNAKKNVFVPIKNIKLEPVDKDTVKDKNVLNKVTDVSPSNIEIEVNAAVPDNSINIEPTNTLHAKKNVFVPITNIKLEPVEKDTVKDKNNQNKVTNVSPSSIQIEENAAVPKNSVNIEPTNTLHAKKNVFVPIENIKLEPVDKDTVKDKNILNKVTDVSPSNIEIEVNAAVPDNSINIEPTNTLHAKKNVFVPITNIKLEPVEKDTVKDKNNQNKVTDVSPSSIRIEENAAVPKNSVNIEPTNTLHAKKNVFVPIENIKLEPVDKDTVKDKNILNKVTDVSPSNIEINENAAVPENGVIIEPTNTLETEINDSVLIKNKELEPMDFVKDKNIQKNITDCVATTNAEIKNNDCLLIDNGNIEPNDILEDDNVQNIITSDLSNPCSDIVFIENDPNETVNHKPVEIIDILDDDDDVDQRNVTGVSNSNLQTEKNIFIPFKNVKIVPTEKVNNDNCVLIENVNVEGNDIMEADNVQNVITSDLSNPCSDIEFIENDPNETVNHMPVEIIDVLDDEDDEINVTDVSNSNLRMDNNVFIPFKNVNIEPTAEKSNDDNCIPIKNVNVECNDIMEADNVQNVITSDLSNQCLDIEFIENDPNETVNHKPVEIIDILDDDENNVTDFSNCNLQKEKNVFVPFKNVKIEPIDKVKDNASVPIENVYVEPNDILEDDNVQNIITSDLSNPCSDIVFIENDPNETVNHKPVEIIDILDDDDDVDPRNVTGVSNSNMQTEKNIFIPFKNVIIEPTDKANDNTSVPIENVNVEPNDILEDDNVQNIITSDLSNPCSDIVFIENDPNETVNHKPVEIIDILDDDVDQRNVTGVSNSNMQTEKNIFIPFKNVIIEPTDKANDNTSVPIENVNVEPNDILEDDNVQNVITSDLSNPCSDIEFIENDPNETVNHKPVEIIDILDDDEDQNNFIDKLNSNMQMEKNVKIEPMDNVNTNNTCVPIENVNVEPNGVLEDDNIQSIFTSDLLNPCSDNELIEFDPNEAVNRKSLKIIDVLDYEDDQNNVLDVSNSNIQLKKNVFVPLKNVNIEPNDTKDDENIQYNVADFVSNTNSEIKDNNCVQVENVNVPFDIMEETYIQNITNDSNSGTKFDANDDVNLEPVGIMHVFDDDYDRNNCTDESNSNVEIDKNDFVQIQSVKIEHIDTMNDEHLQYNFLESESDSDFSLSSYELELCEDLELEAPSALDENCPFQQDYPDTKSDSSLHNEELKVINNTPVEPINTEEEENSQITNIDVSNTNSEPKNNNCVPIENVNLELMDTMNDERFQDNLLESESDSDFSLSSYELELCEDLELEAPSALDENCPFQQNYPDTKSDSSLHNEELKVINNTPVEPINAEEEENSQITNIDVSNTNSEPKNNNCVPIENVNLELMDTMNDERFQYNLLESESELESESDSDFSLSSYELELYEELRLEAPSALDENCPFQQDYPDTKSDSFLHNGELKLINNTPVEPINTVKYKNIEKTVTDVPNSNMEMVKNDFVPMDNVTIEPINIEDNGHLQYDNTDDKEFMETEKVKILPIDIEADAMQIKSKEEVKNTTVLIDAKNIVGVGLHDIEDVDIMQTKPIDVQKDETIVTEDIIESKNIRISPVDLEEADAMQIEYNEDMEDKTINDKNSG